MDGKDIFGCSINQMISNDLIRSEQKDDFMGFLKDKQTYRKLIRHPEILSFEAAALAKASRSKQKMGSNAI